MGALSCYDKTRIYDNLSVSLGYAGRLTDGYHSGWGGRGFESRLRWQHRSSSAAERLNPFVDNSPADMRGTAGSKKMRADGRGLTAELEMV
jgi:hypothetical protein